MGKSTRLNKYWQDNHLRETLRGGGAFLIIRLLGSLGAYAFAWYVSYTYGPEGNGILAFALTGAVLLAALCNVGLNAYAVKIIPQLKLEKNETGIRTFYHRSWMTIVITTLVVSFIVIVFSLFLVSDTLSRDLSMAGFLTVPVSFLLFLSHIYKARKKVTGFSLLQNNIMQIIALIVLMLPFWSRVHPSETVWACVVAGVLMAILGWVNIDIKMPIKTDVSSGGMTIHIRESLPMLAGGLAFMVLNLTDRLMLRFLDDISQLGIYDVTLRLTNLTLLGILSLNAIAEPKFAEFFAQNALVRLRRFARQMTWTGLILSIPIIGMLALFPHFWLGLFGKGDAYLSGELSLYILLSGQLISLFCGSVLVLLNMTGHQRSVQTILATAAVLNIILNAILIPFQGIEGAAWATVISTVLWNIWALLTVRRKLGFWMLG